MANIRNRIEKWFEKAAELIYKNRIKTLAVMATLIIALLSQIPKLTIDISTEGFLHKDDKTLVEYDAFRDQFGRDELILIAIQAPDIFDLNFLKNLKALHEDLETNVPYIEDVTSLINARNTRGKEDELIVEDLLENWPQTTDEANVVKNRAHDNPMYTNLLISPDGKFTSIMLKTHTYTSKGSDSDVMDGFDEDIDSAELENSAKGKKEYITDAENSEAVMAARRIVDKYNSPDFKVFMAGSSAVTHFLKQSMGKDMRKFVLLSLLSVALLLFIMFRRISGVLLPLLIVFLSLLSTISLMATFGVAIKLPTQILPSFILAVSVGYSVHILAIFYHRLRKGDAKKEAILYSISHSGLAILMTAATTAGGLFSFSTSQVAPVADLGIFAGAGVLLAMLYTLVLLPGVLSIVPIKLSEKEKNRSNHTLADRFLDIVGQISTGHPYKILFISTVIFLFSILGIMKIEFSHDPVRWLPEDFFGRIGTEKIDREMRGSIVLEIIIDTGKENGLYEPDFLNKLEKAAVYMEKLEVGKIFTGKAWSLTTILKETNRALHENRNEYYKVPDNKALIAQELLLFENSGSDDMEDFTDSQFSKARFMIKVPFMDAIAYGSYIDHVNQYMKKEFPEAEITTTGMITLLAKVLVNAINSMKTSYLYALAIITILMILLIGRLRIGLLSMVPNLTPIFFTIGIMGWFDIPMNLFTMLVGNIAIGLAVDDTIHFMHNFRRYFEENQDPKRAVMETLHTAGRAMLVTSCVLSLGFFLFMFASMSNLFHFGLLTGLTIILALLADYFIAPALMVVVHKKK
ncbi:MAG: efflux RND transporter permease subunit [Desulfobacteraceae bacterium]|jgi:hypothetical protein